MFLISEIPMFIGIPKIKKYTNTQAKALKEGKKKHCPGDRKLFSETFFFAVEVLQIFKYCLGAFYL